VSDRYEHIKSHKTLFYSRPPQRHVQSIHQPSTDYWLSYFIVKLTVHVGRFDLCDRRQPSDVAHSATAPAKLLSYNHGSIINVLICINIYCYYDSPGHMGRVIRLLVVVVVEYGLTSHQTHYRSYRGRFLRVR